MACPSYLDWLGYAKFATTKIYDRRTSRLEDSPTFKVAYRLGRVTWLRS